MNRFIRVGMALVLGSAIGLASGCGSSGGTNSPEDKVERFRASVLEEIGQMLRVREKDASRPATKVEDFAKYEAGFPAGYRRLSNGEVVLILGAPVEAGSAELVIAFETQVPESGGYVLMQDGTTVKKMSPEEFRAAAKASGTPSVPKGA